MKSAEVARSEGLPSQKQNRTAGLNSKSAQFEGRFCSLRDITAGARGGGTGTCSRTTCAGKSCQRKSDAWMRRPLLQLRFSFQLTSRFRFCTVLSAMYFHVFSLVQLFFQNPSATSSRHYSFRPRGSPLIPSLSVPQKRKKASMTPIYFKIWGMRNYKSRTLEAYGQTK